MLLSPQRFRELVSGQAKGPSAVLWRGLLATAEIPYCGIVAMRNRRFDRRPQFVSHADTPVISVGNLTMGGTGKTPVVQYLANWFRSAGVRVAILSRGYRAVGGELNDEAKELNEKLPDVPLIQNPDRVEGARVAVDELEMQLLLLDDGFQHRRLHRDLDIVLIDALEPFGFEHVFPRGTLREPIGGLRRAQIVGLSRANLVSEATRDNLRQRVLAIHGQATWIELAHLPSALLGRDVSLPVSVLQGLRVGGFCGIGNPVGFQRTLNACGAEVVAFREFPDHHDFSREDIADLQRWAKEHRPDMIVCTHKDLVKINMVSLGACPLRALVVEMNVLKGEAELQTHLQQILARVSLEDAIEDSGK